MGKVNQEFTENKTRGDEHRVQCHRCSQKTRHLVVQSFDLSGSEDFNGESGFEWAGNYQIIQCRGCDEVSFRHLSYFSEDRYCHGDEINDGTTEFLYPQRNLDNRPTKDFYNVPVSVRRIYRETIEAFNGECGTLCAAGLRALVEGISDAQGVSKGPVEVPKKGGGTKIINKKNIEGKISGLVQKGILTQENATALHEHRFLGNEAVHKLTLSYCQMLCMSS